MHFSPNETSFRCCSGILSRDHGAFNYLYRWAVRHMLTEILVVGLLIYLSLQDRLVGLWSMTAAIISLVGASIPSCCFSNASGWRVNFVLQIFVCMMRVAVVSYIIFYFTRVSFSDNTLVVVRDMNLIAVRICQLATIVLSTCSLSPFFHLSLKSTWLINLRPLEENFRGGQNNPHGNRVFAMGQEGLMTDRSDNTRDFYYDDESNPYPRNNNHFDKNSDLESNSDDVHYFYDRKKFDNNYDPDMEIENIEEGNEDEIDDDHSDKKNGPGSVVSSASMSPFYHPNQKKKSVFEFANKMDIDFINPMSGASSVSSRAPTPKNRPLTSSTPGSPPRPRTAETFTTIKNGGNNSRPPSGGSQGRSQAGSRPQTGPQGGVSRPQSGTDRPLTGDNMSSKCNSAKNFFYNNNNEDDNIEVIDYMDSVTNVSAKNKPITIRSANTSGKLSARRDEMEKTFTPRVTSRPGSGHSVASHRSGTSVVPTKAQNVLNEKYFEKYSVPHQNDESDAHSEYSGPSSKGISRFSPRGMTAPRGSNAVELFSVQDLSNKSNSELKDHYT